MPMKRGRDQHQVELGVFSFNLRIYLCESITYTSKSAPFLEAPKGPPLHEVWILLQPDVNTTSLKESPAWCQMKLLLLYKPFHKLWRKIKYVK